MAEHYVGNISGICLNDKGHSCIQFLMGKQKGVFESGLLKLRQNLVALYSLTGRRREKKALNFIGSSLKYMFGTMDHDDEEYLKFILQNITNAEEDVHFVLNQNVKVLKDINKQSQTLRDNQQTLFNNLLALKISMEQQVKFSMQIEWEISFHNLEAHVNYLILSIQAQIDKVHNAILFLKAGVLDPFVMDTDELMRSLSFKSLGYKVTLKDVDTVIDNSELIVASDKESHLIYVILQVPKVASTLFNLYQVLPIPKLFRNEIIILDNISKFLAVSADDSRFIINNTLDCFSTINSYICKPDIEFNSNRNSCIPNIFFHKHDLECQYRKVKDNFNVYNTISKGIIIFSAVGLQVQIICSNYNETRNITGPYFINIHSNCSVNSSIFSFDNSDFETEAYLQDIIPQINCCSEFFYSSTDRKNINATISLNSLKDIKNIDSESITNNWKHFTQIKFPRQIKGWHISMTVGIILLILIIVIVIKVKRVKTKPLICTTVICPTPQPCQEEVNSRENNKKIVLPRYKL